MSDIFMKFIYDMEMPTAPKQPKNLEIPFPSQVRDDSLTYLLSCKLCCMLFACCSKEKRIPSRSNIIFNFYL